MRRKLFALPAFAAAGVLALSATAWAHDCVNLSKKPSSVAFVIGFGCEADGSDTFTVTKTGLRNRVDRVGFDNVKFTGPVGIDIDCDGAPDVTSYEPGGGTGGVIPGAELKNGTNATNCRGLTNVETAFVNGCFG